MRNAHDIGFTILMTVFTKRGRGKQHVAMTAPDPGKIVPFDLSEYGGKNRLGQLLDGDHR